MIRARRVYVSSPRDHHLDDRQQGLKYAILAKLRSEGLETAEAKPQIDAWIDAVKSTQDVFLAYSSKARATANDIGKFISSRGVLVRDWEIDFAPGATILDELLKASKSCLGAIMLLTKDDEFIGE